MGLTSAGFCGKKKSVLGKLGQTVEKATIVAAPTTQQRVYYHAKAFEYLMVTNPRPPPRSKSSSKTVAMVTSPLNPWPSSRTMSRPRNQFPRLLLTNLSLMEWTAPRFPDMRSNSSELLTFGVATT